jgi:hypothetical protein
VLPPLPTIHAIIFFLSSFSPAGTVEQVEEVTQGLQRLDYYLMNVTNEQRYLYARTVRHMRTAESTHSRALGYSLLICGTIVAASFVQVGEGAGRGVCSLGQRGRGV